MNGKNKTLIIIIFILGIINLLSAINLDICYDEKYLWINIIIGLGLLILNIVTNDLKGVFKNIVFWLLILFYGFIVLMWLYGITMIK